METRNLKWNPEKNKHELPFDPNELLQYTFSDTIYLGKPKQCLGINPSIAIDPQKAQEMVKKSILKREFEVDLSNDIITLINQVINLGTVTLKFSILIDSEEKVILRILYNERVSKNIKKKGISCFN